MNYADTVAVVAVLFNPAPEKVAELCSSCSPYKIYLCDNTPGPLPSYTIPENAELISTGYNGGTGYAYNLAAEKSVSLNYKYLLLLDQDSLFPFDKLKEMTDFIEKDSTIGIVSPYHLNPFTEQPAEQHPEKIDSVMASGNLVRLSAWQNAGGFEEHFFLDYVDIEFCFRLKKKRYSIYRLNSVVMPHNEGNVTPVSFFGRMVRTYNYPPLRWYYRCRNLYYLSQTYEKIFPELLRIEWNKFRRDVVKMLLYENNRGQKVAALLKGRKDFRGGVRGISFGKDK